MFKKTFTSILCLGLMLSLICVSMSACSEQTDTVSYETESKEGVTEVKQHKALVVDKNHYQWGNRYSSYYVYELELEIDNGEICCFAEVDDEENYLNIRVGDEIVLYEKQESFGKIPCVNEDNTIKCYI